MSKENLPISVDNNKSLAEKRKEKRDFEQIKRSAKAAISAGIATVGIFAMCSGAGFPITLAGGAALGGFGVNAIIKKIFKPAGKDSMFVFSKNLKGELEIGQNSLEFKKAQKIKELKTAEKAASMGLGMIVSLKNIQQMYEDEEVETHPSKDGKSNVYPQVFSTVTHGDNIKTLEALETLGYIQINRKDFKKKSTFAFERLGFGEKESAKKAFFAQFNPDERKLYEHDFFNIAVQITDKKINVDELVQKYINVNQIDKSNIQERKAVKTIGLIFKTLKNSKIDVKVDELGESQIVYDSDRSLLTRVQEESTDKCEEYRKSVKKDAEQLEKNNKRIQNQPEQIRQDNERIQNQPKQIRQEVQQGEELDI